MSLCHGNICIYILEMICLISLNGYIALSLNTNTSESELTIMVWLYTPAKEDIPPLCTGCTVGVQYLGKSDTHPIESNAAGTAEQ